MSDYYDYCYQYVKLKELLAKAKTIEDLFDRKTFKFFKRFINNTSQGSVGILEHRLALDSPKGHDEGYSEEAIEESRTFILNTCHPSRNFIIYKIGIETPFLSTHEYLVAVSLYIYTSKFLPNFVRPYTFLKDIETSPKEKNPFEITSNHHPNDLILMEYIYSCTTLATLIESKPKLSFDTINSLINQLMIAILIAQNKVDFCHNDLHFDNVLISKCIKRTFMIYVFFTEGSKIPNFALIPTYGYYPVIIDYGFSYTKHLMNKNLYIGIHQDNKGYISHRFDKFTDFKTMLVRLNYSGYKFKDDNNHTRKMFNQDVYRIFKNIPIDHQTGWDKIKEKSISKKLIYTIRPFIFNFIQKEHTRTSFNCSLAESKNKFEFIDTYEALVVDIICSLIILPLKSKPYEDLAENIELFLEEWIKIEKWLSDKYQKIYTLKHIVQLISDGIWKDESNEEIIYEFKRNVFKIMDSISSNITLSNVHFENLYKSILNLSTCFEGLMYEYDLKCITRKTKEWESMPKNIKTSFDLYKIIEPYISNQVTIQLDDYFIVCDSINENTFSFVVQDSSIVSTFNSMDIYEEKIKYLLDSTDFFLED